MRCALIRATQTSRGGSDFSCKDGVARDAASYSTLPKGERTLRCAPSSPRSTFSWSCAIFSLQGNRHLFITLNVATNANTKINPRIIDFRPNHCPP